MTHLYEMDTLWFEPPRNEYISCSYNYKSWKEFTECKPYKLWKPYILSSWSWKSKSQLESNAKPTSRDPKKHVLDFSAKVAPLPTTEEAPTPGPETETQHLQIVFISPSRFDGMHRAEMQVRFEDEEAIRYWLKKHMPTLWKL